MATRNGCLGVGIGQCVKRRKKENVEEGAGIRRAMGWKRKAVMSYFRLRGGVDGGGATPDHIVFQCREVRSRLKDERGRGEWVRENDSRWDSWDSLSSKKWVRMEDTG